MGTAIARRTPDDVRALFEKHREKLASVCAQQLDVSRQIQLVMLCCYHQPKLLDCDFATLLSSAMEGSNLGLSFSRSSGEAYLIPRWRRGKEKSDPAVLHCQFQAGYQGMVKLALEAGVGHVHARAVCRHDDFDWHWSSEHDLKFFHRIPRSGQRGEITDVYAVARMPSGDLVGEIKCVDEIQAIRARSQSADDGPWVTDWEPMAMKTVFRGLYKWLPKTPKLERAIESHDADWDLDGIAAAIAFNGSETLLTTPEPAAIAASSSPEAATLPPTKANRLTAQLAARAAAINGFKPPLPQPASRPETPRTVAPPSPTPAPPATPRTAAELADVAGRLTTSFFATYGRTRRFPVPMTSWSAAQVKQAWDAYEYERDVVKTEPATATR